MGAIKESLGLGLDLVLVMILSFNAIIGTDVVELGYKNYHIDLDSDIFVVEACEYMDAFLNYKPFINLTTNVEWDHFDYFNSEKQYLETFQKLFNKSETDEALPSVEVSNSEISFIEALKILNFLNRCN